MRNRLTIFHLFILLFIANFAFGQSSSSKKYGIIIAISEYPYESGWGSISCYNDVPLVKSALNNQGFKDEKITVLKDEQATKKGIEDAFNALLNKLVPGDYIVIHYSGHGQQITDDNNDEIDGYDEALVAYGAPAYYEDELDYRGEQHFRDDEFGQWIEKFRSKVGKNGQVLVTIDACHSGSGTRGDVKVRGGMEPFQIPGGENKIGKEKEEGAGMASEKIKTSAKKTEKAPYIVMTATQFNELDYETWDDDGNPVGPLSYAMAKVFNSISDDDSYLSVFSRIAAIMAKKVRNQTPSLEGDYNYKIFNGETVQQQPFYTLTKKNSLTRLKINGGKVNGLHNGDRVGLYKSGTQSVEKAEPAVTGTIIEAENFSSFIKLDREYNVKYLNNYWVFVEEYNVKGAKFIINLDSLKNKELKTKLTNILSENPLVTLSAENSNIHATEKNRVISLKHSAEGSLLGEFKHADGGELLKSLKHYAQSDFIRKLSFQDSNYQVKLEMIPVVPELDADGDVVSDEYGNFMVKDTLSIEDLMVNGKIHVNEDDFIMLRITNTGKEDAYFNIIELQPDGIITAVLPQEASNANELFVKAGQSIVPRNFIVTGYYPPYGTEVYKVFATPKPINLTPIITERNYSTKGAKSDIEKVIMSSYGGTRGDDTKTVNKKESGSTYELTFIIEE